MLTLLFLLRQWKTAALLTSTVAFAAVRRQRNKLRKEVEKLDDDLKEAKIVAVYQGERAKRAEDQVNKVLDNTRISGVEEKSDDGTAELAERPNLQF
jgi:hypothetical protein